MAFIESPLFNLMNGYKSASDLLFFHLKIGTGKAVGLKAYLHLLQILYVRMFMLSFFRLSTCVYIRQLWIYSISVNIATEI